MSKLADQPAFATSESEGWYGQPGMTIRTYAAIEAMKGIISNDNMLRSCTVTAGKGPGGSAETPKYVSLVAVAYADAVLAELEKPVA